MLNQFTQFAAAHHTAILALMFVVAAAFLYLKRYDWFWLTDLIYSFPVIGKIARGATDYSMSDHAPWRNVERTLCRDYGSHVAHLSQAEFDQNIVYLKRAHDHGRKPLGEGVVLALAILVVLEGAGFAFLLAPLIAADSSENTRIWLMVGIVLAMAVVLLWVTHAAGHQLYRTRLLRNCFREFQVSGTEKYTTRLVSLGDDQSIDDNEPDHVRCADRVIAYPGDRGSYAWVWIAAILISLIAMGSVILRMDNHIVSADAEAQATAAATTQFGGGAGTLGDLAKSPAVAAAEIEGATIGFSLLAVIFIFTQFVGMSVGYKFGFAGRESAAAFSATRGQGRYQSYFKPFQHRIDIANARLDALRQKLESGFPGTLSFGGCFRDYLDDERTRNGNFHAPIGSEAVTGGDAPSPAPVAVSPADLKLVSDDPVDLAIKHIDGLANDELKIAYVANLNDKLRADVAARLQARVNERAAQSNARQQFEGLF